MHNTSIRTPLALVLLFVGASVASADSAPKTAVVLEPKVDGEIIPQDRDLIDKSVNSALQEQAFQLAPKGERDSLAAAENIKNCYRNECLERIGRLLGAHLVVAYKIKMDIVALPATPQQAPEPKKKGQNSGGSDSSEPVPAGVSPLNWTLDAVLYNIEVGAIGARIDKARCDHCSGPQAADRMADLIKRAVLDDASKPRGQVEIVSEPGNSSVIFDGVELGVTPYKRTTFVGKHEITVKHTGFKSDNREILVTDTKKTAANITLEPGQDPIKYIKEYQPRPKWRYAVGGALIGVGLIGVGIGAYGLSINGSCVDTPVAPLLECNQVRNATPAGVGFLVAGGVLAVAGAVVIALPGKRNPLTADPGSDTFGDKEKPGEKPGAPAPPQAALSVGGLGSGLGFQFSGAY